MEYKFKIKNKKWTIKSAQNGDEHLIMGGLPCIAQLFKQLRIIYFDEGLLDDYEEMRETIVHELTHAFIMTYAISPKEFRDEEFICEFNAVYGLDIQRLADKIMNELYKEEEEVVEQSVIGDGEVVATCQVKVEK